MHKNAALDVAGSPEVAAMLELVLEVMMSDK